MSLNKIMLIGHLGKDPDIRTAQSGAKVASFSVATTKRWRDKASGERKEKTEWHRVVIFNENLVKVCEQWLKKGSKVFIDGEMASRRYTDKEGIERTVWEVVLSVFHSQLVMLDKKPRDDAPDAESEEEYVGSGDYAARKPTTREDLDDEIPF